MRQPDVHLFRACARPGSGGVEQQWNASSSSFVNASHSQSQSITLLRQAHSHAVVPQLPYLGSQSSGRASAGNSIGNCAGLPLGHVSDMIVTFAATLTVDNGDAVGTS
jgi:hypothetical protein